MVTSWRNYFGDRGLKNVKFATKEEIAAALKLNEEKAIKEAQEKEHAFDERLRTATDEQLTFWLQEFENSEPFSRYKAKIKKIKAEIVRRKKTPEKIVA